MKRAQTSWLPVLRALSLAALGGLWAAACGGPQQQGAAGSVCFRTDDCKDGLACVPTAKGSSKSVCGSDLSGIVSMVDGAPAEASAPMGDASGGAAGAVPAGGAAGKGGTAAGGAGGKPATGGATGMAGSGTAGKASGGAPAGGAPAGGAPSGGTGTAGSGTAGSNTGGGGTGGSEPVDAGGG